MKFTDLYKSKLSTAEEAVGIINSGDVIDYGFFNGKPVLCDQALAQRAGELEDVSIYSAVSLPPIPEVAKHPGSFIYMDWQWSRLTRMLDKGFNSTFYSPILYHYAVELYDYFLKDPSVRSFYYNNADKRKDTKWLSIVRVCPMDENGYFNLGPQNSETLAKLKNCHKVIVEVVPKMPRCIGGGSESVHISEVDYIIEAPEDHLCFEMSSPEPGDVDRKIADNILNFIHDGCCIQLGIGAIPNQVGKLIAQSDLKNLGGHTEMLVDAYVDMIEAGKMNGSMKEIDKGRVGYTFAIGSKRMYDHIDNNPVYASYSVDYTNDPRVICKLSNMISINNAVQVDLFSQINAESFEGSQISGNGGMWDFVLGAQWSPGGKSFICLPSTYKDKDGNLKSRIIPALQPGTITTIPRQMVEYIVTEYGAEKMSGAPTWMRTEKMINLAHPDFREDLIKQADKFKVWRRSNKKSA
ncbi:MAG TPA: acetyl-CoA hydrolase/transferase C-terminal domain-containing protein [Spirochaetota bacterium]|nr:acetyl-CoA hydrolase/transferase C-terminal domain-containing protein [Spirochaetota bacterium]